MAKERLDGTETQLGTGKNVHQLGDKLSDIARKQKDKEIQSIYPESTENFELPDDIEYKGSSSSQEGTTNTQSETSSSNKSMSQAAVCIDHSRIVNPQQGTGAMYEFIPASSIKGMEDWVPESDHYKYYQTTTDFPLEFETETQYVYPENLSLYTYEMGNCSEFPPPNKCITGRVYFLLRAKTNLT